MRKLFFTIILVLFATQLPALELNGRLNIETHFQPDDSIVYTLNIDGFYVVEMRIKKNGGCYLSYGIVLNRYWKFKFPKNVFYGKQWNSEFYNVIYTYKPLFDGYKDIEDIFKDCYSYEPPKHINRSNSKISLVVYKTTNDKSTNRFYYLEDPPNKEDPILLHINILNELFLMQDRLEMFTKTLPRGDYNGFGADYLSKNKKNEIEYHLEFYYFDEMYMNKTMPYKGDLELDSVEYHKYNFARELIK